MRVAAAYATVLALAACGRTVPEVTTTATSVSADGVTLTSQAAASPEATAAFPATPAGELVTVNCTACHSPEMILTQPVLGREKWQAEVAKMRTAYKAGIDPSDDPAIVAALTGWEKQR